MEYQTVNYIKRSGWMNYNRLACSTLKTRYETFTENGILPANAHIHTNTHIQTVTHSCYIFIARDTHIWCYLFGMSDVKSDQTGVRFALMHPLIYTAGSKWSTSLLAANFGQAEKLFISSIGHANPSWVSYNHFLTLSVFFVCLSLLFLCFIVRIFTKHQTIFMLWHEMAHRKKQTY